MSQVKKYIGTSLSFCIMDILNGNIEVDEISAIVTSTAFGSIPEAYAAYGHTYWSRWEKDKVLDTLDEVWCLIFQPRLKNMYEHRGHSTAHGWWIDTQTGGYLKYPTQKEENTDDPDPHLID